MGWAEARLGAERLKGAYAWKSLKEAGAVLALGSDFPIENPDVLAGLYEDGQWGDVRLAADGSARRVLPTVAGTDTDPPYHLVGR